VNKFEKGDRVEFVCDYNGLVEVGSQGTVTYVEDSECPEANQFLRIDLDKGGYLAVFDFRIKHLEATPVPKEFRFFRRSDSSISDLPYATFEAALAGWKTFAQDGQEVEIIEVVSHGTYKAVLKVEEA
jgi:hypothetical protein